mmetsp:Transcript_3460/g.6652  ORF Transcript_3460/g.6652 Transcript_3460/m.6652 type:complete len:81 (+) Transcript_3460:958-1200(+)
MPIYVLNKQFFGGQDWKPVNLTSTIPVVSSGRIIANSTMISVCSFVCQCVTACTEILWCKIFPQSIKAKVKRSLPIHGDS